MTPHELRAFWAYEDRGRGMPRPAIRRDIVAAAATAAGFDVVFGPCDAGMGLWLSPDLADAVDWEG